MIAALLFFVLTIAAPATVTPPTLLAQAEGPAVGEMVTIRAGCNDLDDLRAIVGAPSAEESKAATWRALTAGACWIGSWFSAVIDRVVEDLIDHDGDVVRIVRFQDPSDGQVGFAAFVIAKARKG